MTQTAVQQATCKTRDHVLDVAMQEGYGIFEAAEIWRDLKRRTADLQPGQSRIFHIGKTELTASRGEL
jgi:hypothetical protein